ncbi:major facilitator superfamily domain-containing protein [Cercophora newfieldiana]|uniref:Major facilitator superfamily domain-containing protein n=1 Tax=Cercophora newfieldiana TaxID=92897 RepID=A0AA40CLT7_9PEZI|nr:major facilitator superfamily domain-containing protein [Cercophora newfieldiana]
MRLGQDIEKELGGYDGLARPETGAWEGNGLTLAIPPSPISKESKEPRESSPRRPPPLRLDIGSPGASPSEPPNRPLPPRPASKAASASDAPRIPAPTRPPPLRPQAPLGMNPPTRPGTAASQGMDEKGPRMVMSTRRLSYGSITSSSRRPLKYGSGKFSHVELVPQPSDDPDDPLNWPRWRKELNFWSLLLMVALTGVMKTILVTVNAQLAEGYEVSYTSITALTGVPLILSAVSGFGCLVLSRVIGRRPLYLVSLVLLFIGTVWNTNVVSSFNQFLAARIFQGFGWGAFDVLVSGSIQDTFFEHERQHRLTIHSIVAVATTWGPPLLGGVAAADPAGFSLQFIILSAFFTVAVPAITLGAPETVFDRAYTFAQTPATGASKFKVSLPLAPRRLFSVETLNNYIVKLKPYSYRGDVSAATLLQAPRAFIAPTTGLLLLVSLLPYGALWGFSSSLSLLFHPLPFIRSTISIGSLMTGPLILGSIAVAGFAFHSMWQPNFPPRAHMAAVAGGSLLAFIGILTFGLHIDACMTRPENDDGATSIYALNYLGDNVNFPAVAFVLGLLAAGVYTLDATVKPLIRASTMFTSSNLGVALRNTTDMNGGVNCWRAVMAGVFVMAVPNAVWSWDGLRALCIGLAIAQVVVGAMVGSMWWLWGENIRRWDGRMMKLVDLEMLKRNGSFFDTD